MAALVATAIFAVASPAYAAGSASYTTTLKAKQAKIDAYNTQLDKLANDAEIAQEAWNKASIDLTATTVKVQTAQNDLANARAALALQSDILNKRINSIYEDGQLSTFQILLESKSVTDFISRVKYLNTVSTHDANIAGGLRSQRSLLEAEVASLQAEQTKAQEQEFELRARKVEVDLKIADIEKLQKSADSQLQSFIDAEAARRQSQQTGLVSSILSGANKSGIVATPGSPVETALSYIGIKYVWGGATPAGLDCSGLILYTFAQHGVSLPHYSGYQARLGTAVALADIQPNDVVFFGAPIHHVGMYVGGGYFIEAPHTGAFVRLSKLAGRGDIACVRRYAWTVRTAPIWTSGSVTSHQTLP
jgi:cell wall-associated NlpC family hydrolase